ncbi:NDP-hexose 2,3-dehydratase family protein [Nocardiopsis lambiniae]|uniref:NDP-hexose 2,3-dehydratase family protein n=1 Tax=Nocardiopsis lambiniae TaxID=3075539 RepID=A0ABU2MA24_9ACTN|nr:NDP-hexose 2,3-dehydratase family protein [Nocardiopsis sp. DSM 44743]MDT0329521.1 NDP-hexose 2,3-dehydratase family protein [Nocardiopsis sp. DSM 44743]
MRGPDGAPTSDGPADVVAWAAERAAAGGFSVTRVPFAEMDSWGFRPDTGDLVHDSGRFFSITGLRSVVDGDPGTLRHQPVIHQPEVGVLGLLAKEFDGVLHFLVQAKMEPGNPGIVQLSPTVQATRSNYTRAHRGRPVRHIEHFVGSGRGRVLTDVLQSEHGWWFHHKSNRNMIVETDREVEPHEDFRWVTLGTLGALMHVDETVNMDTRTVLACAPVSFGADASAHSDTGLLSWFTEQRASRTLSAERVPLGSLPGWVRTPDRLHHEQDRDFDVVAVAVRARAREVASWSQPLLAPHGPGVAAFLTRRVAGVPHLLVHARVEPGFLDTVELGPTVQCTHDEATAPPGLRPPFLDTVLSASPELVRYRAVHSEEGGRFLHARTRCLVVEDPRPAGASEPPGYLWATPDQLVALARHGHYLDVQARTLLAALTTGALRP